MTLSQKTPLALSHLRQASAWLLVLAGAGAALGVARGVELAQLLALLVLAPVLEETVFRAGLHEALLRRWAHQPAVWANLATAAVFGLAHVLVRADAGAWVVAGPALLIGWTYQRTRRLRDCIALHAAMNAGWLAWQTLGSTA